MTINIFDKLGALGCIVEACGSRVTCDPAPTNTDADYLVEVNVSAQGFLAGLLDEAVSKVANALGEAGFTFDHHDHYNPVMQNGFISWRKDHLNLIVTANAEFARKHRVATAVCKRLNLLDKGDRVAVFQAVLYGNA